MHYIIICNLPPGYLVQLCDFSLVKKKKKKREKILPTALLLLGHHNFHELNSCIKISVRKQMAVQKVDTGNYRPERFNNVH